MSNYYIESPKGLSNFLQVIRLLSSLSAEARSSAAIEMGMTLEELDNDVKNSLRAPKHYETFLSKSSFDDEDDDHDENDDKIPRIWLTCIFTSDEFSPEEQTLGISVIQVRDTFAYLIDASLKTYHMGINPGGFMNVIKYSIDHSLLKEDESPPIVHQNRLFSFEEAENVGIDISNFSLAVGKEKSKPMHYKL
jgi:hypothetical protein